MYCNKIKFETKKEANDFIFNRDSNHKKDLGGATRAYKCGICVDAWHITSQNKKISRAKARKRTKRKMAN